MGAEEGVAVDGRWVVTGDGLTDRHPIIASPLARLKLVVGRVRAKDMVDHCFIPLHNAP